MCSPAFIPMAFGAASGVMSGNAAMDQANSAAKNMRENAYFAGQAAVDALDRGAKDADKQRVRTGLAVGTQRTAQAANGGVVDVGSNADLVADTEMIGELDALTISNNAAREAYGYQVQEEQGYKNAKQTIKAGKKARTASILGGVLGGAGQAYGAGAFDGAFDDQASVGIAGGQKGFRGGMTSGR